MIFPGRNYRWLMKAQPLMPRRPIANQLLKQLVRVAVKEPNAQLESFFA